MKVRKLISIVLVIVLLISTETVYSFSVCGATIEKSVWPGEQMQRLDGYDDIYYYIVPNEYDMLIFNDGKIHYSGDTSDGEAWQTVDLNYIGSDMLYTPDMTQITQHHTERINICGGSWSYFYPVNSSYGSRIVYFKAPGNWQSPSCYVWNDESGNGDGIKLYSDHTGLDVELGDKITVGAGIFKNDVQIEDVSKISYIIEDTSIVNSLGTSIHDNCRFVELQGVSVGTTHVTFTDSNTGYTKRFPVTVYDNSKTAYTISNVPIINSQLNTNFFNKNGLSIDNFKYIINADKTTDVSFNVYNSKYTYAIVEVYDANGNIYSAAKINKMSFGATSIKTAVWDNSCHLVSDFSTGDIDNYRSKLEASETKINIRIPENGYINITNDPSESFLVCFINAIDMLMSIKSISGDFKNFYDYEDKFVDKLTTTMVLDAAYSDLIKNQFVYTKQILKGAGEYILFSSDTFGNFAQTIINNLQTIDIDKLIKETAADFGWQFGENLYKDFAGPVGQILNGLFAAGKLANLIIQENHLVRADGSGGISIQNQGGGVRSASQITVKADTNFNSDIALKAFQLTPNYDLLNLIKDSNPEMYGKLEKGLTDTYNISMVKNGTETQPDKEVEVSIPVSDSVKYFAAAGLIKIYRVESNGSLTDMNAKYSGGRLVFKTNHFSIYMVVKSTADSAQKIGDVNGDDTVSITDATMMQKFIAGLTEFSEEQKKSADTNYDGVISITDATLVQKYIAGLVPSFG